jgi:branched-chain amino acid transport system ATP-binding protein
MTALGASGASDASGLVVKDLYAGYGRVEVVRALSFEVRLGEFIALVGRNGAGKTTALAAVAGLRFSNARGTVSIGGTDISTAAPHQIVGAAVGLVPEGRRVFREMTVLENLKLGAYTHRRTLKGGLEERLNRVWRLFPILLEFREREVAGLSGGQQQMVAIGQALMSDPKVLLLDEPAAGVAPVLVNEIYDRLQALTSEGLGVVVVDQSIERVIVRADRYYVMDNGSVVSSGVAAPEAIDSINRIVLGLGTGLSSLPT